ncbi:VapC toxin family PIN domain ribonuclease [Maritimibacter sp. 55A14]|uniref:type II toxin-antitoxin system VapC family toxin n=1 Tax=Maritimibacter sp. 55A14 TaxID=2174844 RepID=UPI000D61126D|nr:type II toxin-antitoxin system VapC family toxin [Maritimibacter sp. 55A14]PWE32917.1 VapC toxin family PIN domain ribonuclease [Maritimibacter sp. 55A14]
MTQRDVVVDASVVASWLLPSDTGDKTVEILGRVRLHAPSIFWAETRNILLAAERRKRLTETMMVEAVSLLPAVRVRLDTAPEGDYVMGLARVYELTAYDALYLELALRRQAPLLTLDRNLAAAAAGEGLPTLR